MAAPDRVRLGLGGQVKLAARIARETVTEWVDDDATRHGAALAYYAVFSVAPLLLLAISIAGLLYGESTARMEVATRLREFLGPQGAPAVEQLLDRALPTRTGVLATVVSSVALVIGASTVFVQLRASLNHIWDVPPRRGNGLVTLLRQQAFGGLMVLAMGALLLASLTLGTVLSVAGDVVAPWLSLSPAHLEAAYQVLSFALVTALFAVVFKVLPDVPVAWSDVAVGAILTAALFALGRSAIAAYLVYAGVTTAYGAAGSLVAFLVWVYWSAQILLLGAEFTQVYGRRAGSRRRECDLLEHHKKPSPR
ncbi:MAG: YihY/virulence factor BrkB family protein [Pseudomonadota bacterium]|nr:YihY/virulence factor BrkB family protein [Pseudomonadota bacterium]